LKAGRGVERVRFVVLCLAGLVMAIPFLWMFTSSFKTRAEAGDADFFSHAPSLSSYFMLFDARPDPVSGRFLGLRFGRWFFNSVFVAFVVTVLQVLSSAMAAFAFSRLRWRWRDRVFALYLATLMIPGVMTVIPNFAIMVKLHLLNSYEGLILPAAFSAFGTFLLRQFMLSIPPALDEAAVIDGASSWQIFWEVIMPLASPGLIALGIVTFLGNYQSFFWPLVLNNDPQLLTLPVGMVQLDTSYGRQTEMIMAATVLNIVPLIVLFVAGQRFLVKGLLMGSVKG
jgi:multiple sugar transport system permease protein